VIVIWVYNLLFNLKKYWKEFLILNIWFLGPIGVQSEYAKVLTARYILFSLPFLIIFIASAFLEIKTVWKWFLAVFLVIFAVQSILFDHWLITDPTRAPLPRSERSGYLEEWTAGQGIYEASVYLQNYQLQNPTQKVVVGTEGYFGTLPDGLEAYLNNDKNITIVGVGLNFTDIPSPLVNAQKAGDTTFLLINNDRFKGDYKKEGLTLIAEYPKAIHPDGTHESLMFLNFP